MKQFFSSKHVFYVGNFDVVPISNQCFIFLRIKQTDQSSYLGKQFIFLAKKINNSFLLPQSLVILIWLFRGTLYLSNTLTLTKSNHSSVSVLVKLVVVFRPGSITEY